MDNTLSEIREQIGLRSGWIASEHQSRIESGINAAYQEILTRKNWYGLYKTEGVTATLGQGMMSFPPHISVITKVLDRDTDRAITFMSDEELVVRFASELDQGGTPTHASHMGTKGVAQQPSAATAISIVGSDAGDTSQSITIEGIADGIPAVERLTASGTATVTGSLSFSDIDSVSKDSDSDGIIDVYADTSRLARIPRQARSVHYNWIRFNRTLEGQRTYYTTYRRRVRPLIEDADVPVLADIGILLVEGGFANVLRQQRDFAKASIQEQKFQELLEQHSDIISVQDGVVNFSPNQDWLAQRRW